MKSCCRLFFHEGCFAEAWNSDPLGRALPGLLNVKVWKTPAQVRAAALEVIRSGHEPAQAHFSLICSKDLLGPKRMSMSLSFTTKFPVGIMLSLSGTSSLTATT